MNKPKRKCKWRELPNKAYPLAILELIQSILIHRPVISYPLTKDEKKRRVLRLTFKP